MKKILLLYVLPIITAAGLLITALFVFSGDESSQNNLNVAVSCNFTDPIKDIAALFEKKTGHKVTLIFGSTGKHYAQIKNGAPYDVFLAADMRRPRLLEKEGVALPSSRFTYATGKLVLWSPRAGYVDSEGKVLKTDYRHIAIANPKLAPYGQAAQEVLQKLGIWDNLGQRLVRGQNVCQAFQFVKSGNAELGFVALSQVTRSGRPAEGSWWDVPQSLHNPIQQQAVLLKDNDAARAFLDFLRSEESLEIIRKYGYGTL